MVPHYKTKTMNIVSLLLRLCFVSSSTKSYRGPAYPLSSTPAASSMSSGGGKIKRDRASLRPSSKRPEEDEVRALYIQTFFLMLKCYNTRGIYNFIRLCSYFRWLRYRTSQEFHFPSAHPLCQPSASPLPCRLPPSPPLLAPALKSQLLLLQRQQILTRYKVCHKCLDPTMMISKILPINNILVFFPFQDPPKASTPPCVPFTFSSPIVKATAASPPSYSPSVRTFKKMSQIS